MDEKIKEYRTKCKKCKWCKYFKDNSGYCGVDYYCYYTCELKDKIIYFKDLRNICKYYELKENKNEKSNERRTK